MCNVLGWRSLRENLSDIDMLISPDKNNVMRISEYHKGYYDRAFEVHADLCMRNSGNPYLQKVHDHFRLGDGSHVTIMERLVYLRRIDECLETKRNKDIKDFYKFINEGYKYPDIEEKFLGDDRLREALRALFVTIDFYNNSNYPVIDYDLDTHCWNFMGRLMPDKSIHPVLSDPFQSIDKDSAKEMHLIEFLSPWTLSLRRKLGIMDNAQFQRLPEIKGNSWVLN